jgi:hypothetical protein
VPRWQGQLVRWRSYAEGALAVAGAGPPWHRGIVAVATLVAAVLIGLLSNIPMATVVAPALAFFMTMADVEGPLGTRVAMLGWSSAFVAVAGFASILCANAPIEFGVVFAGLTFIAGVLAWAGSPFLQASRYAVVVGLLLTNTRGLGVLDYLVLLLAAVVIALGARSIESAWAPDQKRGDFSTPRQAWFKLRAARPLLWRYALSYTVMAGFAWVLGRLVDQVHPTWLTVSTLVVMWPDAVRSYQRILQRVFGTIAGALVAVTLISVLRDRVVLSVVALAMAFFLPHFIRRNYWLHSGLVVVFVLVALHVSSGDPMIKHAVAERIGDVLLGCVFAMLGTLAAFGPGHRRAAKAAARANS